MFTPFQLPDESSSWSRGLLTISHKWHFEMAFLGG